jgi:thiol-disulfide isomerase/thioredoxin
VRIPARSPLKRGRHEPPHCRALGTGRRRRSSAGRWCLVAAAQPSRGRGNQSLRFDTPEGREITLASLRGQPLLVNFWGTWCPPCIAEMPELDRFAREYAASGWRVLGLAVDNLKAVREHLAARPVGYTIAMAGFEGAGLSRQLGNDQGGLPFTVAFNAQGRAVHRKAGQTTLAELQDWARRM